MGIMNEEYNQIEAAEQAETAQNELKQVAESDQAVVIQENENGDRVLSADELKDKENSDATTNNDTGEASSPADTKDAEPQIQDLEYENYEQFSAGATSLLRSSEEILSSINENEPVSDEIISQISAQLAKLNYLLKQNFSEHDDQELYAKLHELKPRLIEVKVKRIKEDYADLITKFSQFEGSSEEKVTQFALELAKLVTSNPSKQEMVAAKFKILLEKNGVPIDPEINTFEDAYEQMDEDEEISHLEQDLQQDTANGEESTKKFKQYAKVFGGVSLLAGQSLKELTFNRNNMDLGTFFSFILNPSGRFASSDISKYAGENGEVPYHVFKERFRNFKDVGIALFTCAEKLKQYPGFNAWEENNKKNLKSVKEKASSTRTVSILIDLNEKAFNGGDAEKNWGLFAGEFASALFGKEGLTLSREEINFIKELLANNAKQLKEFWNIGDAENTSENETKTAEEPSSDETQAGPEPITDISEVPEPDQQQPSI